MGWMTPAESAAVRGRLEEFAAEVFAPLARVDQRDKGMTYLRGLPLDGTGGASRCSRWPSGWGSITRGCSSSCPRPPGRWPRSASGWSALAIEVISPDVWVFQDPRPPRTGTAPRRADASPLQRWPSPGSLQR